MRRFLLLLPSLVLPSVLASFGCSGSSTAATPTAGSTDDGGTSTTADPPRDDLDETAVKGRIVSFGGTPVPSARVRIGTTVVVADAEGRFVVPKAPERYDVAVVEEDRDATVVVGLTSREPVVLVNEEAPTSRTPLLLRYPEAHENEFYAILHESEAFGTTSLTGDMTTTSFSTSLPWNGKEPGPARVLALGFERSELGSVQRYFGVAEATLTPKGGEALDWAPTFAPVDEVRVTVAAEIPDGMAIYERIPTLRFEGSSGWGFAGRNERAGATSVLVPKVPGLRRGVAILAAQAGRRNDRVFASSTTVVPLGEDDTLPRVTLSPLPVLKTPAANAADFAVGSELSWSGEGTCTATVFPVRADAPRIRLVTRGTSVVVPDLSDLGFTLAKATAYRWFVRCVKAAAEDEARTLEDALPTGTTARSAYQDVTTRQ